MLRRERKPCSSSRFVEHVRTIDRKHWSRKRSLKQKVRPCDRVNKFSHRRQQGLPLEHLKLEPRPWIRQKALPGFGKDRPLGSRRRSVLPSVLSQSLFQLDSSAMW